MLLLVTRPTQVRSSTQTSGYPDAKPHPVRPVIAKDIFGHKMLKEGTRSNSMTGSSLGRRRMPRVLMRASEPYPPRSNRIFIHPGIKIESSCGTPLDTFCGHRIGREWEKLPPYLTVQPLIIFHNPHQVSARRQRMQEPGPAAAGRRMRQFACLVVYGRTLGAGQAGKGGQTRAQEAGHADGRSSRGLRRGGSGAGSRLRGGSDIWLGVVCRPGRSEVASHR